MLALLSLLLFTLGPEPVIVLDRVDLIEHNHFYDEQCRHVFDQLVFYDWSRRDSRYQVRDWRLVKSATQVPALDVNRWLYVVTWHDGPTLRQVRATSVRETFTQFDPELIERVYLAKEQRRELSSANKRSITEAADHVP